MTIRSHFRHPRPGLQGHPQQQGNRPGTSNTSSGGGGLILAIFGVTTFSPEARAQVTLPPITTTAPAIGGGNILCYGMDCASIIRQMQWDAQYDFEMPNPTLTPLDREEFCGRLDDAQPAGCSGTEAPSTPGFDPNWQGNGCGPGSTAGWVLSFTEYLGQGLVGQFSGDRNAPFPEVSFLDACNAHDDCYGRLGTKPTCDGNFRSAMESACNGSLVSGTGPHNSCLAFAGAYHSAVTFGGESAYNDAQADRSCALWHHEMKKNQCDQ